MNLSGLNIISFFYSNTFQKILYALRNFVETFSHA